MEVTDEQRKLAQQARMYGEQMQALSESAGGRKVCKLYCTNSNIYKIAIILL